MPSKNSKAFLPSKVASKSREAPMVYGGTFARYLEEWISNDGSLSGESNAALVEVFLCHIIQNIAFLPGMHIVSRCHHIRSSA